jgi:hypothetical protein
MSILRTGVYYMDTSYVLAIGTNFKNISSKFLCMLVKNKEE